MRLIFHITIINFIIINTQVSRSHKAFLIGSPDNIKLSKTQSHKKGQSGGFLDRLLGPLLKTGLFLIKNVPKPLTKNVLIPLGLTAAVLATDGTIHEKIFRSGIKRLIFSNKEINDIMKIVKYLEESGLLIKGVSETVQNEAK